MDIPLRYSRGLVKERRRNGRKERKKWGRGVGNKEEKKGGKKEGNLTPSSMKAQQPTFSSSGRTHASPKSARTSYSCQVIPLRAICLLSLSHKKE